jgi:predicted GNAT family N-acyltransferase
MTAEDLAAAHGLSREQQWPHREEDWAAMLQLGHGLVAERDGAVLGTTMWWLFGDSHASLGMVIVAKAAQGMGVGRKLMEGAIAAIGDRSILLNATDEGLNLYRSLGFDVTGTVYQHQGAPFDVPIAQLIPNERVAPMKAGELADISRLDRAATGLDRSAVIDYLFDAAQGVVLNRDGEQAGYALFRRFGRGYSIGPTLAPDIGGARALISHWLGSNTGMFCRLDVPEDSGLSAWLDELGLPCVGRVTRMCRGTPPPANPASAHPTGHAPTGDTIRAWSLINQALG